MPSLSFWKSLSDFASLGFRCRHRPMGMSLSTSSGVASALAPSAFSLPAKCRPSPEWGTRSSLATNRSVGSLNATTPGRSNPGNGSSFRARAALVMFAGYSAAPPSRLVVPAQRIVAIEESLGEAGVLLALAATAYHAIDGGALPELIVGHGVLGRLLARVAVARGGAPIVWERMAERRDGAQGYIVKDPDDDERRDYGSIYDASGDAGLLDSLIGRLARGKEIVLAGFYSKPISFSFSACLHQGSAIAHRSRVGAARSCCGHRDGRRRATEPRRPDHSSIRSHAFRNFPSRGL